MPRRHIAVAALVGVAVLVLGVLVAASPPAPATLATAPSPRVYDSVTEDARARVALPRPFVFAVVGDYGTGGDAEARVARLVGSWSPAFIITTGDDYYHEAGGNGAERYDNSTARFYSRWMTNVSSGAGQAWRNAFFPCLGNHDYSDAGVDTYLGYFDLPGRWLFSSSGNERYYDFTYGNVHFFALNSNAAEPSGMTSQSVQAQWLRAQLGESKARWNVVYDHNPPFSSDLTHGSDSRMQWPYAAWGADAVLSGHAHTYERVSRDGMTYFVNGLGGAGRYGFKTTAVAGSQRRYSADWGAQKVTVTANTMTFEFYTAGGKLIDRYVLTQP